VFLKQDSGNADAHLLLGTALALVPRRSEALAELNRAIELRPGFAPGYNTLGMVLGRFAEPDTAREAFEKAIRLDPQLQRLMLIYRWFSHNATNFPLRGNT